MLSKFITISLFIFISIISNIYAARTGNISGTVIDANTREPLNGANVVLLNTSFGSATDFDGKFKIAQVPAGTYTIKVSYIGYKDSTLTVNIVEGRTLMIDFSLKFDVIEGQTVLVTAQAQGQLAAINQQLSSNTIKNIVSSDKIMEVPDANAAESIGRLPGISILRSGGEASKVAIRGLSPTYNTITINGQKIPSTDQDNRSVDLSMISPEVLAGIAVTKALTADMDADAIGGTVNLILNDAPKGFRYNFRITSGYNRQRDEFGQYNGALTLSNRFVDDKFGLMVTANRNKVPRGSDRFRSDYVTYRNVRGDEAIAPLNAIRPQLQYINDMRTRSSFSVFMDYKLPNGKLKLNNFISRLDRDYENRGLNYGTSDPVLQATLNVQRIQTDILTTSLEGEHDFSFGTLDWSASRNSSTSRIPYDADFPFQLSSAINLTKTQDVTPDDIINATSYLGRISEMKMFTGTGFSTSESFERDYTGQFNFKTPFTFSNSFNGYLKLGAKYDTKKRERNGEAKRIDWYSELPNDTLIQTYHSKWGEPGFQFVKTMDGYPSIVNYLKNDNINNFLDGQYAFPININADELTRVLDNYMLDNIYLLDLSSEFDNYKADEKVTAAYVMSEINIGDFMFLPGIRFEYTQNETVARNGYYPGDVVDPVKKNLTVFFDDTTAVHSYSNWFPMIHLRYKPVNWGDIRFAYTKTVSRPILSDILPIKKENPVNKIVTMGRPDLKPQVSTNYDIFLSLYTNDIGLFTLGGFYKKIDNLIYTRANNLIFDAAEAEEQGIETRFVQWYLNRPENSKDATTIKGIEIEWQTNFRWLPNPFSGIVLTMNYTILKSETQYPYSFTRRVKGRPTLIDSTRAGIMPNQPNNIANITLGYDNGPFSGRASMLYQGRTLSEVTNLPEYSGYTGDLYRFDLSFTYHLTDYLSLFLEANNITNEPDESFLFGTGDPLRFPTSRAFYGYTIDFGIGIRN